MPSLFAQKWIAKRPKLDAKLGEVVTIQLMLRGEFIGASPDPANAAFDATAIMIVEDILAMSGALLTGTAERADVIISDPSATFLPTQFGPGRPQPTVGAWITRKTVMDASGNPQVFTVIAPPLIDSVGQVVVRLAPVPPGQQ